MLYFPSLHREPRYEPARVIPPKRDPSHLDWLAAQGRLVVRQNEDREGRLAEDVDLSDLLELDDNKFEGMESDREFDPLDED